MKKVIVATLGLCGLVLLPSLDAMEVENGFTGLQKDIILKLCKLLAREHAKLRNVFGMCADYLPWRNHCYFVESRQPEITKLKNTLVKYGKEMFGSTIEDFGGLIGRLKRVNLSRTPLDKCDYQPKTNAVLDLISLSKPVVVPLFRGLLALKKLEKNEAEAFVNYFVRSIVFDKMDNSVPRENLYEIVKFFAQKEIMPDSVFYTFCCAPRLLPKGKDDERTVRLEFEQGLREELILLVFKKRTDIIRRHPNTDYAYINHINDEGKTIYDELSSLPDDPTATFVRNKCEAKKANELKSLNDEGKTIYDELSSLSGDPTATFVRNKCEAKKANELKSPVKYVPFIEAGEEPDEEEEEEEEEEVPPSGEKK
ncbi:hypothetical protein FACS1894126_4890 [Alphaproteobacteria bacterium]|nr:hypothetical protein FACS1894126_4890 [Alphaproteobacteria bacterium]